MRKNSKFVGVWIPNDTYAWFVEYLKVNSLGPDFSVRFRQFLYKLQEGKSVQSSVGINPKICLREILKGIVKDPKRGLCKVCKEKLPFSFLHCRDPEKEAQYEY